ncbi:MAG: peroxiredoxin family protein [Planctomycetota bacterium]
MKPHLVRWHKEYADKGLVVIDIDDGTQDSFERLKVSVEKSGVPYAVLWDKDGRNIAAYGVQAMPAAYLIGPDGKVVWEGVPDSRKADEYEKRIRAELDKIKK